MNKIGIIGRNELVLGFSALGLDVFAVTTGEEATATLSRLVDSGEFAVLFLTEDFAVSAKEQLLRAAEMHTLAVCVIPVPGAAGDYGMTLLRQNALRATGTDILFKETK